MREAFGADVPLVVMSPLEPGEEAGAGGFEIVVSFARGLRAAARRCRLRRPRQGRHGHGALGPDPGGCARRRPRAGGGHTAAVARRPDVAPRHLGRRPAFGGQSRPRSSPTSIAGSRPARGTWPTSAAALRASETRYDAVRCGIALYGVSPFGDGPRAHGLLPALRWTSRVAGLRDLAPGQSAGYGRRLIADRPLRVAYVPVGYADGYPRLKSGRRRCWCAASGASVAATISMGSATGIVDERVELGDEVVLIGEQGGGERHGRGAGRTCRRSPGRPSARPPSRHAGADGRISDSGHRRRWRVSPENH